MNFAACFRFRQGVRAPAVTSIALLSCGALCAMAAPQDPSPADPMTQLVSVDKSINVSDGKIPIILVHGDEERNDSTLDGWKPFVDYFDANQLSSRYRLYRFQYPADQYSVWELGRSLRNKIEDA